MSRLTDAALSSEMMLIYLLYPGLIFFMGTKAFTVRFRCRNCRKDYIIPEPCHPYCSVECKDNIESSTSTCKYCAVIFKDMGRSRTYCSPLCARKAVSKKRKEYVLKSYDFAIFSRDNFRCVYCGKSVEDDISLTIDHIYPISKGGKHDIFNLATCCSDCNCKKGMSLLPESLILEIWNKLSNLEIPTEFYVPYEEMMLHFKKKYKSRLNKLHRLQ